MSALVCQGCGQEIAPDSPSPFRCPNAGDGGEHVVGRVLDLPVRFPLEGHPNPFVRYRALTHAHALALSRQMSDDAFVAMVLELDRAINEVWGRGFVTTPFGRSAALSDALDLEEPGGVWVKDETCNVSGSHKARHLMGLAILGETHARLGVTRADAAPPLAIASCGNAALAAAVVARAWERALDVFIPKDAHPRVVAELERLGARVHVCAREPGVTGDPCYHAFRHAVNDGAVPFCCQGPDNGLTVEGGETLAWEMVGALVHDGRSLDRLFVQVGGGALASACVQGFRDAVAHGAQVTMPRLHAVQTRGAFPLRRAWERLAQRVFDRLGTERPRSDREVAEQLKARASSFEVEAELAFATKNRAELMWPWETEPKSVAHGILDDETYDWLAIVRGTIETGGFPIVVDEPRLFEANELGRARTGIDVDATGTAGLAGLLELRAHGEVGDHESIGVLFTGVRR
jgi:threonine synthase